MSTSTDRIIIDPMPETTISQAAEEAIEAARATGHLHALKFNGATIPIDPTSTVADVCAALDAHYAEQSRIYNLPENVAKRAAAAAEAERVRALEMEQTIARARTATEAELRDSKGPWPCTEAELTRYIDALATRQHDYGTCVYAMSLAATAAFNYIAGRLGTTGFQASCADMDILRHTRGFTWGRVLNYENLLYPQYLHDDHFPSVGALLNEHRDELAKRARAKLAESPEAAPRVLAHWRNLAARGRSEATK